MIEPTGCAGCCVRGETYCDRCDLLVGLPGLHMIDVVDDVGLAVTVESPPAEQGCRACGVIAEGRGRRTVSLVDVPCFGRPLPPVRGVQGGDLAGQVVIPGPRRQPVDAHRHTPRKAGERCR